MATEIPHIQSPKPEHRPSPLFRIDRTNNIPEYMGYVIEFCHKTSETVIQAGKPRS